MSNMHDVAARPTAGVEKKRFLLLVSSESKFGVLNERGSLPVQY